MIKYYIVTPSYNNWQWLQNCLPSVADQASENICVHHHVQDGGSSDKTVEELEKWQKQSQGRENYHFSYQSKADKGMYHAINLAWEQMPDDADFMAHLNCDEQYLPHALADIAPYFEKYPQADILLGSYFVVDKEQNYICHRRPAQPKLWSSRLNCACITNSSFYRASRFRQHGIRYDIRWRSIGDLVLYRDLLAAGARFQIIDLITSSFACTGSNLAWGELSHKEWAKLAEESPLYASRLQFFVYRWVNLKRRILDLFVAPPKELLLYKNGERERSREVIDKPTHKWTGLPFRED